jgi:hypothetical protein
MARWVAEITQVWSRGGTHTMELARVMVAARHRLRYGQWSKLWQSGRMPFAKRKGEMLVVIGDRLGGIDAQYIARLPASWNVLYELARLPWALVKALIEEGAIHPRLTVEEARALVAKCNGSRRGNGSEKANLKRRLKQFVNFVRTGLGGWRADERELVRKELKGLVAELEVRIGKDPERNGGGSSASPVSQLTQQT